MYDSYFVKKYNLNTRQIRSSITFSHVDRTRVIIIWQLQFKIFETRSQKLNTYAPMQGGARSCVCRGGLKYSVLVGKLLSLTLHAPIALPLLTIFIFPSINSSISSTSLMQYSMASAGSVKLLWAMFSTCVCLSWAISIMRRDWEGANVGVIALRLKLTFGPIGDACGWAAEYNVKYS